MELTKRAELTQLLDGFERKQREQQLERDARLLALNQFLSGYAELAQSLIKPAFEEFAADLGARGHPCTIDLNTRAEPGDSVSAAKITITIFPAGATLAHGNPSLSYTAAPNQRKIVAGRCSVTSSGGIVGSVVGEYEMPQFTRAVVEQHLLDLATSVFAPPA
jgi:hypothetical protein